MKTYYSLLCLTCTLLVSILGSCSSDESEFLKRNLTDLRFDYIESSKVFTIRASGDWRIDIPNEYSWIQVEPSNGIGDGETYQQITVKCNRNRNIDREGVIYLNGSGQSNVPINVFQQNGLFEWKPAGNGRPFLIDKYPIVGAESEATIKVPYAKAVGDENYPIEVVLSGKGAEGLSVAESAVVIAEEGDGMLNIPIAGIAKTQGRVNVKVKINNQEFGEEITLAAIGVKVISQDFNKFPWGGDCIGNKAGVTTTVATASMTLADPTKACVIGDNGANGSGITSTVRTGNPAFYQSIGLDGWYGLRNYMRPGYLQLGAASATDQQFGSVITPGLDIPNGMTYDVMVTFKGAKYNAPAPDRLVLGLFSKNTQGLSYTDMINVDVKKTMVEIPFEIGYQSWGTFSSVVENATSASALFISLPESMYVSGAVQAGRAYVDDIVIIY